MRMLTKTIKLAVLIAAVLLVYDAKAQTGVLNPSDTVIDYNKNRPPLTPPANTLAKWVRTRHVPWNTDSFKCYYYNNMAFRLRFPKTYQHNVADGKKYPLFIFFHGRGEKGTIYDDEFQLYHGGELHEAAVNDSLFDGFLLYPQIGDDTWSSTDLGTVQKIVSNYLIPQVKVDKFRIMVDGLSAGGSASWSFLINYPKLVAACLPISAASISYGNASYIANYKYTPIWHFQGQLDQAPTPYTSKQVGTAILNAGGNYKYTEYANKGHGIWYNAWAESDYFAFLNRANKANAWPLFGRTEFCPGQTIDVTLGVTVGLDGYEWRKNTVSLSGETNNTLHVTDTGTYDCRIKIGTVWSDWSPIPVVIKIKPPTVTPDIQISGLASRVFPSPDGSAGVPLEEPEGYETYKWQKDPSPTVLGTSKTFLAGSPGFYKATVTEKFGCSTVASPLFEVINADGPNKPDAPFNVTATEQGKTSIQLHWDQVANPVDNETNFEIYQSALEEGPYQLIKITNADTSDYTAEGLRSGTTFYYIIRAINNTAASPVTTPVSATTEPDVTPPSPPLNLQAGEITRTSVELIWSPSTDDVGIAGYDVYVNGIRSFVTTDTIFTVYNLIYAKTYKFIVKAKDFSNNISDSSNEVTATTLLKGLIYKYYQGNWNNLPNFKKLTPAETGVTPNVTIESKAEEDNFAFYWEGNIKIPVAGTYTFRLTSNDGSKLYLATNYSYTGLSLINNDGTHTDQTKDSTITLNAGSYPFIVTYFQKVTGSTMSVLWNTPQTSGEFTAIPDSVFTDDVSLNSPSPLTAVAISQTKVSLNWADNNGNETGNQVWRSKSQTSNYALFKTLPANTTTFTTNRLAGDGSVYYFKVRVQANDFYSPFSNVAGVSTLTSNYVIKLNINDGTVDGPPQAIPWNNTNSLPATGFTISNLIGDSSKYTGVKFTLVKNGFDASNNGGAVTGNNTGVFPDNVMKSSWFLNRLDTSKIKISNLNQTMIYTFTFFGSRGGITDDRIAAYTIGNQTVTLNAKNNTTQPVQIDGVRPDSTGTVFISVYALDNSDFAYLNAMVIQGIVDTTITRFASNISATAPLFNDVMPQDNNLVAYPNPFDNDIILRLSLKQNVARLGITLTDASGKTLYVDRFNNVSKGIWQQKLNVQGRLLQHGMYFIKVYGLPGEKPKIVKVIK